MAARSERNKDDEEEGKIPVFTVLKNGAILKNIFIVNKPPEEPLCISNIRSIASFRDHEDVLVVGRHPNCNIMLTHPSISRFHLQIRSKPSLQKLSLVDLSSVHGTWISEKKLDPGVSVYLKEGDTLRIGRSSRVYRLHWIPISLAYDLENPFVSKLDLDKEEEIREEDEECEEEKEEMIQNGGFCSVDVQNLDSWEPSMVEEVISLTSDEEGKSPFNCVLFESENSPHLEFVVECNNAESSLNMESHSSLAQKSRKTKILNSLKEHLTESVCLPNAIAANEIKMLQFQDVIDGVSPDAFTSKLLPGKQEASLEKHWSDLVNLDPTFFDKQSEVGSDDMMEETEFTSMLGSDDRVKDILIAEAGKFLTERMSLPVEEPDSEFQNVEIVEEVFRYSQSEGEKEDKFGQEHESKLQAELSANDEIIQDIDNTENQTPKVSQQQKPEIRLFCSHIKLEQEQGIMELKNRATMVPIQSQLLNAKGKSSSEASGHVSSVNNIKDIKSGQILNKQANPYHISGNQKRSWDMILDTASLLNKESRKALQLLRGLKGTRLIIPRMVIRELHSMKQQFCIFRRTSEASLVLEWIEECMEKAKWWINVQSLTNEEKSISLKSWTFSVGIGSSLRSVSSADEDHILDFALLYRTKQNNDGQLVLLSDDAALKIKSMAEGLLCETVQEFRESLVNPFSDRFLWANSCRFPLRQLSNREHARAATNLGIDLTIYTPGITQIVPSCDIARLKLHSSLKLSNSLLKLPVADITDTKSIVNLYCSLHFKGRHFTRYPEGLGSFVAPLSFFLIFFLVSLLSIKCICSDGVTNSESGNRQTLNHISTHSILRCRKRHHRTQFNPQTLSRCHSRRISAAWGTNRGATCCGGFNILGHNPSQCPSAHDSLQLHFQLLR
ncbi:FHA domain-containing protein PS1 [Senna tora]|uniref:FHA domain-containing protein PS1 n=1 Tax=Senna tora TaxID=362788 RepID=A0A834W6Q2_9FABA|nr:FHA domain-containing protein PS1 [Senna tora]